MPTVLVLGGLLCVSVLLRSPKQSSTGLATTACERDSVPKPHFRHLQGRGSDSQCAKGLLHSLALCFGAAAGGSNVKFRRWMWLESSG